MHPLAKAFDRLDDFVAVQRAHPDGITIEAVELLQRAAGIDAADRSVIAERMAALGTEEGGAVLLGVLVGLLAADEASND